MCLLLTAAYAFRAPLLTSAANLWIVNDKLTRADAIVVLGGGLESRPFGAAELYHQGLAPRILITDVRWELGKLLGVGQSETEIARQILIKKGVPETAITTVGNQVTSTWEEAVALRDWTATNTVVKSLIIVTDVFHTRRCRWLFRKQLRNTSVRIQLAGVGNPDYSAATWWCHESGLLGFQNELVKLPYNRMKY